MKMFNDIYDSARPYVACYAILQKGNNIAMVLRKNTGWMDGHYGLPAGKLEYYETFTAGAVREGKEEAGVDILESDMEFTHVVHRHGEDEDTFMDWVDIYFVARKWQGEPYNAEPEKSEQLDWLDINNLPSNIVPAQREALLQIAKGAKYSEYWND